MAALAVARAVRHGARRVAVKIASTPVSFQVQNTNTHGGAGMHDRRRHLHRAGPPHRRLGEADPAQKKRRGRDPLPARTRAGRVAVELPGGQEPTTSSPGMARAGHASVIGGPARLRRQRPAASGKSLCIGAQADIAHQIVRPAEGRVLHGAGRARPRKFKRVALAGHSAAGQISITEAYTYRDLNALVVVGFSFSNLPRAQRRVRVPARSRATRAGIRSPGPHELRVLRPHADAGFRSIDVPQRAEGRSRTPRSSCTTPTRAGTTYSLIDTIQKQAANDPKVKVPVLVACGAQRRPVRGRSAARPRQIASSKGSVLLLKNSGHATAARDAARRRSGSGSTASSTGPGF